MDPNQRGKGQCGSKVHEPRARLEKRKPVDRVSKDRVEVDAEWCGGRGYLGENRNLTYSLRRHRG